MNVSHSLWMEDPQNIEHCLQSFLFQGLTPAQFTPVGALALSPLSFDKGAVIYSPHSFRQALGIVLKGRVEILRQEDGRRVLMNQLEAGGIFGAAALYGSSEEYVTEIRALEPCRILFISQEQLSAMMKQDFAIAENYIRFLSGRIRFLNQRIAGFTGGAADRRLALYLLEHSDEQGTVNLPRSIVALASALNVGRSSLYRSLDVLTEAGLIRRENGKITILDLHRLRAVVQ